MVSDQSSVISELGSPPYNKTLLVGILTMAANRCELTGNSYDSVRAGTYRGIASAVAENLINPKDLTAEKLQKVLS